MSAFLSPPLTSHTGQPGPEIELGDLVLDSQGLRMHLETWHLGSTQINPKNARARGKLENHLDLHFHFATEKKNTQRGGGYYLI